MVDSPLYRESTENIEEYNKKLKYFKDYLKS